VPFLRLTRDQRGYENTFLLHSTHPGERPRVLYWYRTAPGVRVGRPPLDEDAIRAIEEQYPDIEFDWPRILEESTTLAPEVERRPERPRRKKAPAVSAPEPAEAAAEAISESQTQAASPPPSQTEFEPPPTVTRSAPPDFLADLVGREIATRLRARYAEISARIQQHTDAATREVWQSRADALNPDTWLTPEQVLRGVERADRLFDELRREMTHERNAGDER
jgi:hypothetical protein